MLREKSAGIIIYRQNKKREYLLLHYQGEKGNDYWDFPKGHVEKGETDEQAALREAKEETGLQDLKIIPGFKEKMTYYFKKGKDLIYKEVVFFTAEAQPDSKIAISAEHIGFAWHDYKTAVETATYKTAKELIEKTELFLNKKEKSGLRRFFQ